MSSTSRSRHSSQRHAGPSRTSPSAWTSGTSRWPTACAPRSCSPTPTVRFWSVHAIGDSPWSVLVSDEIYFNLKTDGTGRTAGFDRNKFYGGLVLDVGRGAKVSAGYELTEVEPTGGLNEFHTI